jgi:hypothetical protein
MSINNGFTVTLPGNSNMEKHPRSTGGLYTVVPHGGASPLNFSGQTLNDDTRWEVSMLSPHYTHNFFNFREDCLVHFVMDKPAPSKTAPAETASNKVIVTGDAELDSSEFVIEERMTHWVAEKHVTESGRVGTELV